MQKTGRQSNHKKKKIKCIIEVNIGSLETQRTQCWARLRILKIEISLSWCDEIDKREANRTMLALQFEPRAFTKTPKCEMAR